MLVLRNGSNVIAEGGKPLWNNEVNALRIENTDKITIGLATTGTIAISWGDGTVLTLGTQVVRYNASKLYSSVGKWNISITNQENIKEIYIDQINCSSINSLSSWFSQFTNLEKLMVNYGKFSGDMGIIIEMYLTKLMQLGLTCYNSDCSINISKCNSFWTRCTYLSVVGSGVTGNVSDVNLNLKCIYFSLYGNFTPGNIDGILKNGYTALTGIAIYAETGGYITCTLPFDSWDIPITLQSINMRGLSVSKIQNFNFKNITTFSIANGNTEVDVSNNTSFDAFVARDYITLSITYSGMRIKIPLDKITSKSISNLNVFTNTNINDSFGDVSQVFKNALWAITLSGMPISSSVYGTISTDNKISTGWLWVINADIVCDANTFKSFSYKPSLLNLKSLKNFTGDISGASFAGAYNQYNGVIISDMQNLYADITTFTWGTNYANIYMPIYFSYNPHFTGNLANLTLWANKSGIDLSYCKYTNIPAFISKVFINRNTCLKAVGGRTTISVQGNVDNNLLTGTYQSPNLGTYVGNINNLTEAQIDNLANGLDYTGTGTNTAWSDKEKIWFLVNCKNSSIDTSSRYRVTINY